MAPLLGPSHMLSRSRWVLGIGIGLLALLVALVALLLWVRPAITIVNAHSQTIQETLVQLPASRVAFDAIASGQQATIYYHPRQQDGVYRYRLQLADGTAIVGSCGYVTNSQWGEELVLTLENGGDVRCDNRR